MNFQAHNREQKQVWEAFRSGRPTRVPVFVGCNPRMLLLDDALNRRHVSFEQYLCEPEVMLQVNLEFQDWLHHTLKFDQEMGVPEEGWRIGVDFQNIFEAAWLGAPVHFSDNNCPYASTLLNDDNKRLLFDRGMPEFFDSSGWMQRLWSAYEYFEQQRQEGFEYKGKPVASVEQAACDTDGPFTLAMELRGEGACIDLIEDPDYFHELMTYITDATIDRMCRFRERLSRPIKSDDFGFADDSIALLSTEQFREHVLPYHRKLVNHFWTGQGELFIHLCGDASRHFKLLQDELGVTIFDTGFPIDLHRMRQELGPDVLLYGGPRAALLQSGPIERIQEVTRDLVTGPVARGRFILREANNLAPGTPPEHVAAMYETARSFGSYENSSLGDG